MSRQSTRWEQLGNLLTAMVAVIVSGKTDLLFDQMEDQPSRIEEIASGLLEIPKDIRMKFRTGGPYCGSMKEIANRLDVTAGTVSNVFRGAARTKRIALAILQFLVDREGEQVLDLVSNRVSPYDCPFTSEERGGFRRKGRYYGALAAVARKFALARGTVSMVVRGESSSERIVDALRAEMRRIDLNPKRPKAAAIPFPKEVRLQFYRGGKYCGILSSVGDKMGFKPGWVSAVAAGRYSSPDVADALRREMERIDSELSSPDATAIRREEIPLFSFHGKYCGAYTAVGHSLGLNAHVVRRHAIGRAYGERTLEIRRAVREEIARIDHERGEPVATLTDSERANFRRGGCYFGLYTVIANRFQLSNTRVMEAATSENASLFLRRALREEMARIDAELAAKNGGAK